MRSKSSLKPMKIEVCINQLGDLTLLESMEVDRVELCIELGCGGLTPSLSFIAKAMELSSKPLHVLVRPRSGNFVYSTEECSLMLQECKKIQSLGVTGIVIGMLDSSHDLPVSTLRRFRDQLGKTTLVYHRAFDEVKTPTKALGQLYEIGFDGVLTSGQHPTALEGIDVLIDWKMRIKDDFFILPGGGINAQNCKKFDVAGFDWIHLSAKQLIKTKRASKFDATQYKLDTTKLADVLDRLRN